MNPFVSSGQVFCFLLFDMIVMMIHLGYIIEYI